MRHIFLAAIAIVALGLSGCATAMTASSHSERGLTMTPYHTFAWGPADALPTGDPRLDKDPFFQDHVQGAVERQLATRGLELGRLESADLLIHYHANISRRIDVNRVDRAYGYCQADDCYGSAVEYEAGTLVLDIIDARTRRLIWRGWAQKSVEDLLNNQDRMARAIDEAVTRMLRRLPPAS